MYERRRLTEVVGHREGTAGGAHPPFGSSCRRTGGTCGVSRRNEYIDEVLQDLLGSARGGTVIGWLGQPLAVPRLRSP